MGDLDRSEDIVQDIFIKLWQQPPILQEGKSMPSYIYTMVRNRALEVMRRDDIGQRVHKQILYLHTEASEDDITEAEIEKHLLIDKIYVSIRQLPPKSREAFTLSKINGLTYAQIAEKMGISVKTVEHHISRALKSLREMLADQVSLFFLILHIFLLK